MTEFLVKAHHDYEVQREDELVLSIGDIISVTDRSDNDWWQGEKVGTGQSGWFPSNFVDPVSDSTPAAPAQRKQSSGSAPVLARVTEDFVAAEPDELSLWKGGVVTVLEQMEGWWRGDLNGKTGIFPATYVKLISEELPAGESEPTEEVKSKFKLAAYGVKQGGVGALFAGGVVPTLKKKKASVDEGVSPLAHAPPPPHVEPPPKPATAPPVKQPSADKLSSPPVTSSPADTTVSPPVPLQTTSQPISTSLAKAIVTRNYDADLEDEISLIRGEYITIVDRNVGDGWWKGTNERSETGVFPADCVLELQEETAPPRSSRSSRQASRPQSEITQPTSPSSTTSPPPLPKTARTPSQSSTSETVSQANPSSSPPPSHPGTEEIISPTVSSAPRLPLARPPRPPSIASSETSTSPTSENAQSRQSVHSISDVISEEGEQTENTAHSRMAKPPKSFLSKTGVPLPSISPRSPPPHSRSTSTGTLTSPTSQLSPVELSATEPRPKIPSRPRPPSQSSDSSSLSTLHHDSVLPTPPGQSSEPLPEETTENEEAAVTEATEITTEDYDHVTSEDVKDSIVSEPDPELIEEVQAIEVTAEAHETTETDLKPTDAESNPIATEEEVQELETPSPETPKKVELPELPSGPKLTGPSRARPMPNRRGISGSALKEGIVSQTSILQDAVDKDPEPEPTTKPLADEAEISGRAAPPPKPVKPIFNKIPTAFAKAAESGSAPVFPLRKVERKWEGAAVTATAAADDKDKDSGIVRESAGPVRSVASRFNVPTSGGGNEVLETKLKNFVKSEVEKVRKELEAIIAEERAKRSVLEAEVEALKERLAEV